MLTDECNEAVLQAAIDAAGLGNDTRFKFETFPATPDWSEEKDSARLNAIAEEISTVNIIPPLPLTVLIFDILNTVFVVSTQQYIWICLPPPISSALLLSVVVQDKMVFTIQ